LLWPVYQSVGHRKSRQRARLRQWRGTKAQQNAAIAQRNAAAQQNAAERANDAADSQMWVISGAGDPHPRLLKPVANDLSQRPLGADRMSAFGGKADITRTCGDVCF
jgi:hypothetical protein